MKLLVLSDKIYGGTSAYSRICHETCTRLVGMGHKVAHIPMGFANKMGKNVYENVVVYPSGNNPFGEDVAIPCYADFNADMLITIKENWNFNQIPNMAINYVPQVIVDHSPISDAMTRNLKFAFKVISVSRHAQFELMQKKIKSVYIPHGCLVYDTLVYTEHGQRKLGDVVESKEDKFVLGFDGEKVRFVPILKYHKVTVQDDTLVKIEVGNNELIGTLDHPVLSLERFVPLKDVTQGLKVACVNTQVCANRNIFNRHRPSVYSRDNRRRRINLNIKSKSKENALSIISSIHYGNQHQRASYGILRQENQIRPNNTSQRGLHKKSVPTWLCQRIQGEETLGANYSILSDKEGTSKSNASICQLASLQERGQSISHTVFSERTETSTQCKIILYAVSKKSLIPLRAQKTWVYDLKTKTRNFIANNIIVHNCDTEVFKPVDRAKSRKLWHFDPDEFVVGIVAMNRSRKMIPRMLQGYKRFLELNPDIRSHLMLWTNVNPSTYPDAAMLGVADVGVALLPEIARLGLNETVRWPDEKTIVNGIPDWAGEDYENGYDMVKLYNSMDALLLCSGGEGVGLPLLEAQACRVPVVTTNYAGGTEHVGAGFAVPWKDYVILNTPGTRYALADIDKMAEALTRLTNANREKMGEKARLFAQHFDWGRIMDVYWKPFLQDCADELFPKYTKGGMSNWAN